MEREEREEREGGRERERERGGERDGLDARYCSIARSLPAIARP